MARKAVEAREFSATRRAEDAKEAVSQKKTANVVEQLS